jgi:hypothetical protein
MGVGMPNDEKQAKILETIARVDGPLESQCWMWLRPWRAKGYGEVQYKGKRHRAHRFSYEAFNGPVPDDLAVRQTCDNVWCVNPDHLFVEAGPAKGKAGNRKLTERQVREIRQLIAEDQLTLKAIARQYGVTPGAIYGIKSGRTWNWLT